MNEIIYTEIPITPENEAQIEEIKAKQFGLYVEGRIVPASCEGIGLFDREGKTVVRVYFDTTPDDVMHGEATAQLMTAWGSWKAGEVAGIKTRGRPISGQMTIRGFKPAKELGKDPTVVGTAMTAITDWETGESKYKRGDQFEIELSHLVRPMFDPASNDPTRPPAGARR